MKMQNKLAVGTAQFGLDYGISNKRGTIPRSEAFAILDEMRSNGIDMLDTATAYGNAEQIIGEYQKTVESKFKIVSKLAPDSKEGFRTSFCTLLENLSERHIYGLLHHAPASLLSDTTLWSEFVKAKHDSKITKIGLSVYYPEELETLAAKGIHPDIIQAPFSVFDRRFETAFKKLKERGCEIHIRSVFLQGLAFMAPDNLPATLAGAGDALSALNSFALDRGYSIAHICLGFALSSGLVDRVVVGVDGIESLRENINIAETVSENSLQYEEFNALRIEDENIILPFKWKL